MEPSELTIEEAQQKLLNREISSQELTLSCLKRIKDKDSRIKSFLGIDEKFSLDQAKKADKMIATKKDDRPLLGIPLAWKDNILVAGQKVSAASKILGSYTAPYDATVTSKLKASGAVYLGRTNCDEFAMGASCENSAFGPTHNPWNLKRVPGGSSGGSAAAVAANMCLAALGSDTGGSVRQPASFCGLVGLKPTYGRVSRYGLIALASSMDQIGPITKTVKDAAIILKQIAGPDPRDATSIDRAVMNYPAECEKDIRGLVAGIPKEFFVEGIDKEVKKAVQKAIKNIEELGVKIKEVSLPLSEYALPVYYIILPAEASANLARYDGIRFGATVDAKAVPNLLSFYKQVRALGFGDEVKRRIMTGTYVLSAGYVDAYYKTAQRVRQLIAREFEEVLSQVDVLLTPTSPTVAFGLGEKVDDPVTMYLSDIFTASANVAGLPGLSVPCGLAAKLPVGLQILGKQFDEATILRLGYHFEQSTSWHKEKSPLISK